MVSHPAISAVSPFPSDLPPVSLRDAELLASLLELRFNLTALAKQHNLPALDLIHWASSPAIRTYIRALREITDECTRLRQSQARRSAIDTLEAITTTAEDPIEKRRAASSLLRSDAPRRPNRAHEAPSAPPPDPLRAVNYHHTPRADGLPNEPVLPPEAFGDSPLPDPPVVPLRLQDHTYAPARGCAPSSSLCPEELVYRRVEDLLYNIDVYQPGANLFPYLTPGAPVFGIPTPDIVQDFLLKQARGPLFEILNSSYHHVQEVERTETAATVTVGILTGINTLSPGLRVYLERSDAGPHPNCWLISRIDEEQVPWRGPVPQPLPPRYHPAYPDPRYPHRPP